MIVEAQRQGLPEGQSVLSSLSAVTANDKTDSVRVGTSQQPADSQILGWNGSAVDDLPNPAPCTVQAFGVFRATGIPSMRSMGDLTIRCSTSQPESCPIMIRGSICGIVLLETE